MVEIDTEKNEDKSIIKYAFYVVSCIVDLVSIIGIFNEAVSDAPNHIKTAIYVILFILAIIAALAYSVIATNIQRKKTLENIGGTFQILHKELAHKVRDRIGEIDENTRFSSDKKKELFRTCSEIVESLVTLQTRLNGKKKICACIKIVDTKNGRSHRIKAGDNKNDVFVINYIRSKNTERNRKNMRDKIPVVGNTDFESIYDGEDYFSCGDLMTLYKLLRFLPICCIYYYGSI